MAHPELESALAVFLDRFSPPRHIAGNAAAIEQEVAQITDAFDRFAPRDGFHLWWLQVTTELVRRMKTRAWPMVGEVEAACQSVRQAGTGAMGEDAVKSMILDRMEEWYRRHGSQMPGYGKASRTAALIRRGVFANEREARFYGFDQSYDMTERALGQPIGREEAAHHNGVMEKLHERSRRAADNQSISAAPRQPTMPSTRTGDKED